MTVGFIGLGNMAKAMIEGMIKNKVVAPENIIASRRSESERNVSASKYGIRVTADNIQVVQEADLIVLAIKPQFYSVILEKIAPHVGTKCIVSIAPGKTIAYLHEQLGEECKIIRTMPNTPALVGEGCTGVTFEEKVPEEKRQEILTIFESFGKAYEVPESLMDVVVGVSGSSPAYVFMMIEAMADGAVHQGMPRDLAYQFAAQAVLGSAKMVLETGIHPGALKDMVCSPGGTTIEAVRTLESNGFRSAIIEAERACVEKARSL